MAQTIKTADGELYVQGDTIVGRMVIDGSITKYYRGDHFHREDGPAFVQQNKYGINIFEAYWRDGVRHRGDNLPAYIERNNAGVVVREEYWYNGRAISNSVIKEKKEKEIAELIEKLKREVSAESARADAAEAKLDDLKAKIKAALE